MMSLRGLVTGYKRLWRAQRETTLYWSSFFILFAVETAIAIVYEAGWFALIGVFGAFVSLMAIITAIETGEGRLSNVYLMVRRWRNRDWSDRNWRL